MENTILEEVYEAILAGDDLPHIPHSDVFYVQKAIHINTGVFYPLDRIERSMYLEGMLDRSQVKEPMEEREWEKLYNKE